MEKIAGVTKLERTWAIPVTVEKLTDNRITTGEYRNRWKIQKDKHEEG